MPSFLSFRAPPGVPATGCPGALWPFTPFVGALVVAAVSCGAPVARQGDGANGGSRGAGSAQGGNPSGSGSASAAGGSGIVIAGAGSGGEATCAAVVTCKDLGYDCGTTGDGCGGLLQCGSACPSGQLCGGAGQANVCGAPKCAPVTCASLGVSCGTEGDGCGGTMDCGSCTAPDTCGGVVPGKCGHDADDGGVCVPATCAQRGADCGPVGDGCGGVLACGTCDANTTCGGGGKPSVCGAPTCLSKTCAQLGLGCGSQNDTCGNVMDCGTCSAGQSCGGGGKPSQCGSTGPTCAGLCLQQTTCTAPATTSISGTVYAPNGTDPLPNVLVYVPNAAVQAFPAGVTCDNCNTSLVSGAPLVTATTAVDGTFKITDMPVGTNIPLVIQNGRWRRQVVVPKVAACVNTTVAATLTRFPRTKAEGDIPRMGFVTGSVDALECVLRKIGIADSEFGDPTTPSAPRVQFYQGDGAPGATYSASTPIEDSLWGSQATINKYDMVFFACQGEPIDRTTASQNVLIDYANAGGRIFATHYSYVWLYNDSPFSSTATWDADQTPNFTSDPETGVINQGFPKGLALAQWLKLLYPASTLGQIAINTLRHDFDGVVAPSTLWISLQDPNYPAPVPMHYTFDTPVGAAPANQCGRVLYDDFHVEDQSFFLQPTFPAECTSGTMTPQEKMLEFMIFDLGSPLCSAPPTSCPATTCAAQNVQCGPLGDGCGKLLDCGACPSGMTCGGGGTPGICQAPPCKPLSCADQKIACGPAGDGCGNELPSCGMCPSGMSCGGGGTPGACGSGACKPQPCPPELECGPAGDGCGNLIQCGSCPPGETCGGGGTAGKCGAPVCVPKTCKGLGLDCGPVTDGCNHVLQCGTCGGGQVCGGGANPRANVCGTLSEGQ